MTSQPGTRSDSARRIEAFIDALAGRHRRLTRLAAATRAALGLALLWIAALVVWYAAARLSAWTSVLVVAAALAGSIAWAAVAWRRQPRPASRVGLARLAEDHLGGLEDRLVTAVDVVERDTSSPIAALLLDDTARRVSDDDVDLVIPAARVRGAAWRASAAVAALLALAFLGREPVGQATRAVGLWAFPARLMLDVTPGDARIRPDTPFVVHATTSEHARGLIPELTVRMQDAARTARMKPDAEGRFSFSLGFEESAAQIRGVRIVRHEAPPHETTADAARDGRRRRARRHARHNEAREKAGSPRAPEYTPGSRNSPMPFSA